jgi:hypothetical protein
MTYIDRKAALEEAWRALMLLDESIGEDVRGNLRGVDTIEIGLRRMAPALARLSAYPRATNEGTPSLADVVAYLAMTGMVRDEVVALVDTVVTSVKASFYRGLASDEVASAESARSLLYDALSDVISQFEAAGDE